MSLPPTASPHSSQSAATTIFDSPDEADGDMDTVGYAANNAANRSIGNAIDPDTSTLNTVLRDATASGNPNDSSGKATASTSVINTNQNTNLQSSTTSSIPSTASCRVCFDPGTLSDPLCAPCRCRGDMQYIHESCLKTWVSTPRFVTAQSLSQSSAISRTNSATNSTTSAAMSRTNSPAMTRTNSAAMTRTNSAGSNSNARLNSLEGAAGTRSGGDAVAGLNTQNSASSVVDAGGVTGVSSASASSVPAPTDQHTADATSSHEPGVSESASGSTQNANTQNADPAVNSADSSMQQHNTGANITTQSATSTPAPANNNITTPDSEAPDLEVPLCEICNAPYNVPNLDLRLFNVNLKSEQLSEVQIIQHQLGDRRIMNALGAAYFRKIYKMAKERDMLILTVLGPHYPGPWQDDADLAGMRNARGADRNRRGSGRCFGRNRMSNSTGNQHQGGGGNRGVASGGESSDNNGVSSLNNVERAWFNDDFIRESIIDRVCCVGGRGRNNARNNAGNNGAASSTDNNAGASSRNAGNNTNARANASASASTSANADSATTHSASTNFDDTNVDDPNNETNRPLPRRRFLDCVGGRTAKKRCTNSKSTSKSALSNGKNNTNNAGAYAKSSSSSSESGEYKSAVEDENGNGKDGKP